MPGLRKTADSCAPRQFHQVADLYPGAKAVARSFSPNGVADPCLALHKFPPTDRCRRFENSSGAGSTEIMTEIGQQLHAERMDRAEESAIEGHLNFLPQIIPRVGVAACAVASRPLRDW